MPDITFKAGLLEEVATALGGVLALTPSALPKGRYALAKAGVQLDAGKHFALFSGHKRELLEKHALKVDGKPVTRDVGGGRIQYDMGRGFGVTTPEYEAEYAALCDEDIVLPGTRQITHAELGPCPITAGQLAVLMRAGFIEDREPE